MRHIKNYYKEIILLAIILFYTYLRMNLVLFRYYDHDEFQHLNATWLLSKGVIPYKEFFEHHFPWLYHFSTFIFLFFNKIETNSKEAVSSILFSRFYMQFYWITSLFFLYKTINKVQSKSFSYLYLCLSTACIPLLLKTLEFRGDVPALCFYSISLYCLISAIKEKSSKHYYLSTLMFGICIMFTQKYLIILPGFLLCTFIYLRQLNTSKSISTIINGSLFLMLPFVLTYCLYSFYGANKDFIYYNLTLNFNWVKEAPHWHYTKLFANKSLIICILSLVGILVLAFKKNRKHVDKTLVCIFSISLIWFFCALHLVPISALQFYIIATPALIFFATTALYITYKRISFLAILIPFSLMIYKDYNYFNYSRDFHINQDKVITYIINNSNPDDKILVGNPNYALYRRSISYYSIMHEGIFLVMPDKDKRFIERTLKTDGLRPKFISYDWNIKNLPLNISDVIIKHYKELPNLTLSRGSDYEYKLLKRID